MADTACRAYICTKQCKQFVPGRKTPSAHSCATCTHSEQNHQPTTQGSKAKR